MIRIAAVSAALLAFALPAQAQALRTEDLIGRWGVAAYWSDSDAAKVTAQARGFCSQPYVITRGAEGSARMFEAFEGRPQDVVVQGGQIVAASGSARATKAIQSWNGSVLVFNYVDDEPKRKYGNMVFVRCGR
ncbi:MAG: hypothetical protein IOC90_00835 [Methylocystis sp.]|jgi:hypothetical protein|nr:hypothetical protein [Methylocystis sp.]